MHMDSWFKKDILAGRKALVIGGSSESGPVVCRILAEHGASVAFTYLSRELEAETITHELSKVTQSQAFQFDLLDRSHVLSLMGEVEQAFGPVDILINLGGPPPVYTDLRDLEPEQFDLMIDGHFKGYFSLACEAAKRMEQAQGGLIINVSATSSLKYSHSAYGMAKACINSMTKFLAHSFAPKVRVLTLIPGLIELEEIDPQLRKNRSAESPLKRNVTPDELGMLILAASSPAYASATGVEIIADGGFWLLHR